MFAPDEVMACACKPIALSADMELMPASTVRLLIVMEIYPVEALRLAALEESE
jgi:hypothetical protein